MNKIEFWGHIWRGGEIPFACFELHDDYFVPKQWGQRIFEVAINFFRVTTDKGKIIYKAIEVSCLINLHFPSNLNFSFRGMLLNAECSASLFNQVALQISRYFFLTRVKPYLVFLLSWISSITTFLSLSSLSRPWFEFLAIS